MTAPRVYIEPPTVQPYRYGLFGAAQPITPTDGHWVIGGVEWESLASYMAATYAAGAFALADQGGTRATKTLADSVPVGTAWPFAVYAGIDCGSIGRPPADFLDRAVEVLALSRQHAVEAELWTGGGQARVTALNADVAASGATVLTGTQASPTAVSLLAAVAACERWVADHYNGRALLHAPRNVAPYADRLRQVHHDHDNDDAVVTGLGTRWVFGGGYDGTGPDAQAPAAGRAWLYVTGQVLIAADTVIRPSSFAEVLDRSTNREFAIAEQVHMLGIDGPWAAALVDLTL